MEIVSISLPWHTSQLHLGRLCGGHGLDMLSVWIRYDESNLLGLRRTMFHDVPLLCHQSHRPRIMKQDRRLAKPNDCLPLAMFQGHTVAQRNGQDAVAFSGILSTIALDRDRL